MATFCLPISGTIFSAHSRGEISGQLMVLERALAPITRAQSAIASVNVSYTLAFAKISSAPAAREVASALGKIFGATKHRLSMHIFFIARATAPMLPGCVVSTKTILIFDNKIVSTLKKAESLPKDLLFYSDFPTAH